MTALATGYIAQEWGLRPAPFFLGLAYAGLGLGISLLSVRETRAHAHHEAADHVITNGELHDQLSTREIFVLQEASPGERACRQSEVGRHAGGVGGRSVEVTSRSNRWRGARHSS